MKPPGRKISYQGVPRSHSFLRPILWFVWAVATLTVCGAAASTFSLRTKADETAVYLGTLHRETELIEVSVPRDATLSDVVVGIGDLVAKGQTVATFNTSGMQDSYDRMSAELRVLSYELECLNSYQPPDPATVQAATELADLQRVAADCEAAHRNAKNNLHVLMKRQRRLREQRTIINGYLALGFADGSIQLQSGHKRKLDLLLLRNQIDRRLVELMQSKAAHFAELSMLKTRSARAIVGKISDLAHRRAQLAKQIETPRLSMPETGTVRRIRQLGFKGPAVEEFTLIEAASSGNAQYHLKFHADLDDIAKLDAARAVVIEVHGWDDGRQELRGDIAGFLDADGDHIVVEVSLHASSIEILNNPKSGLAFAGEASLSRVSVTQMPTSIANHLLTLAEPAMSALSSNHTLFSQLAKR